MPPSSEIFGIVGYLPTAMEKRRPRRLPRPRKDSGFDRVDRRYLQQQDALLTPPEITTDFFCLRLIGDRSNREKDFGVIQKDR
jgi:hypothetical protein